MADAAQRGTKRKRHETNEKDAAVKIAGKLHHDLKALRRAAKKAKAFEMQKLLKKLKGLRDKDQSSKEIPEFEAQLEVLKRTDFEPIANTALATKLKKDRILSENVFLQAAITSQLSTNLLVPAETGTPSAKVQSRLLSSKVLATEVTAVLEDLRSAIQPGTKDATQEAHIASEDHEAGKPVEHRKKAKAGSVKAAEVVDAGSSDTDGDGEGSMDEDVLQDDGWESGSVRSGPDAVEGRETSPSGDSDSEGGSDEVEDDDDHSSRPIRTQQPSTSRTKLVAESTFLPTLSVGFIRGDSDSEWSDSEAKTADVRKNRRGQRARRAIWEKKYGKNANHTKKQREAMEASARAAGRHRERKPQDHRPPSARGGRSKPGITPQHHQLADAGWEQRSKTDSGSSIKLPPAPSRWEERPLHPSWEAKKKQKERQSGGILPAQGTKIKF